LTAVPIRDPKFTFLGTGTSSGVPVIGCDCEVCTSTDRRDSRLRTSACLEWLDPDGKPRCVLIDTSPDLRQQALKHQIRRVDAILYTHNHVDHTFGLDEVRRYNAMQQHAIDVYAEPRVIEFLKRVYQHIFDSDKNINQSFVATLIAFPIEPARPIDLHGLRFTPLRAMHGRLPVVGFRIEPAPAHPSPLTASLFPLIYLTDVSAIPNETWPLLEGCRTLVLDALRHRHHPTHLTLSQAIGIAQNVAAERTYFVHMTHDLGHAKTQAELPEGMQLAWDGLVLGHENGASGVVRSG
jgi:phosphoribosyl 1,2-cyclic phosphate phosphodiesterase